jgi:hypothetical protein
LKFLIHPHALADRVPVLRQLVENMVRLVCHAIAFAPDSLRSSPAGGLAAERIDPPIR